MNKDGEHRGGVDRAPAASATQGASLTRRWTELAVHPRRRGWGQEPALLPGRRGGVDIAEPW